MFYEGSGKTTPLFLWSAMDHLRKHVRTRVLLDYDHFNDHVETPVLVCTNQGVLNVIRTLISTYGLRYANWVTALAPAGYIGVSEAQFDNIDAYISEFLEGTTDMTFCGDFVEALNNLAVSFEAGCCDNGSYGAGKAEPGASTNEDDEEDYPPGFDSYAEYRTYKCAIANRLIEGMRLDMTWLAAGTIVTLAGTILVATLLTPIPFDEILAIVGFALALLAQGILGATGAAVADELDDSRQELVCILYDALDATAAKTAILDFMDSALTTTQAALFSSVWSFAAVNALFDKNVLLETSPLPSDVVCDECTSECEVCIAQGGNEDVNGIYTIVTPKLITMTSGWAPSWHWGIPDFNSLVSPATYCGPGVELESYDLVGFTGHASEAYRIYDSGLSLVYQSGSPPDWSLFTDVRRLQFKSSTAFTGTITLV